MLKQNSYNSESEQSSFQILSELYDYEKQNNYQRILQILISIKSQKSFLKSLEQSSQLNNLLELTRLCNKTSLQNEIQIDLRQIISVLLLAEQLLKFIEVKDSKIINLEISIYNNLACKLLEAGEEGKIEEYLQKAMNLLGNTYKLELFGITYTNLTAFYFFKADYYQSYCLAEKGLYKLEPYIFKNIKDNSVTTIEKLQQDNEFISILISNLSCYMYLALSLRKLQRTNDLRINTTEKNSKTFFVNGFKLARKYLGDIHIFTRKFYNFAFNQKFDIDDTFSSVEKEDKEIRNSSLDLFKDETKKTITKKLFFNSNKTGFRALSGQKKRFGEENEKWLNKSQNFMGKDLPKYIKQMKEMKKTMQNMSKIRDKFEFNEKSLLLKQNFELLMQQKELEEIIQKKREYQIPQMPQMNSIYYQNPQHFMPSMFLPRASHDFVGYPPQGYPPQNPSPLIPPEKSQIEALLQKQKEFEESLKVLKLENKKSILEKEEQDKELFKLRNYIKKLESEKNLVETRKKSIQNSQIQIPTKFDRSFNDSNISDSSNKQKGKFSNRSDRNFILPLEKLTSQDSKPPQLTKIPPTKPVLNIPKEETPKKDIKIEDKQIQEIKPHHNIQKTLAEEKRTNSIKKILLNLGEKGSFKTHKDNMKKQDSLTSLDLGIELSNPAYLLKTILLQCSKNLVIRKILALENKKYIFEFRIIYENEGISFKLTCSEFDNKKNIKEEVLAIQLVKKILQIIDYKDVLANTMPLKTVSNVLNFVRMFIMPFVGIGDYKGIDETDQLFEKKVEIWPKAHGLISDPIKVSFLSEEFYLFFHYLINDLFRIVLYNPKSGKTVRIDVQFDQSSLKKYFLLLDQRNTQLEEINDLTNMIEILEDEDPSSDSLKSSKEIMDRYNNRTNDMIIDNYAIIDLNSFLSFLEKNFKEFEEFIKINNIGGIDVICGEERIRFFKIKVWNEGTRVRHGCLIENNEKKELEIMLKNGFETHAPEKKMVKTSGKTVYSLDNLWKDYGLQYNKLDICDKLMIYGLILDCYNLETFEKVMDKDDYERYDPNAISFSIIDIGGHFRYFIGDSFKIPITISLMGVKGVPIGVKAVLFNPNECKENGVFFSINPQLWKKKIDNEEARKKQRYLSIMPLEGDYSLSFVLKSIGFKIVANFLIIQKNTNGIWELLGKNLIKGISQIDVLENIITMENVLNMYKKE